MLNSVFGGGSVLKMDSLQLQAIFVNENTSLLERKEVRFHISSKKWETIVKMHTYFKEHLYKIK
jgi:hypothetical protein